MGGFHYTRDTDNIVTVTMDMDGPVNIMNDSYTGFMEETITRLETEKETLAGVIITSAKPTFFVGGDLKRIYGLRPSQSKEFFETLEAKKGFLRRLEKLGIPVVAAINGTALGGGFEICLACSHRIAIDHPKTLLGFPEVSLGLLPGAGGVVRMVHMLGLKQALPYLTEGTIVSPAKALEAGMIDALVPDRDALLNQAVDWIKANPEVVKPWDQKGYNMPGGDHNDASVRRFIALLIPKLSKQNPEGLPGPEMILDVAANTTRVDFDTALRIESRGLTALVMTPQAKGLVAYKFLQASKNQVAAPDAYVSRLRDKYQAEAARMVDEGLSSVFINAAARQAGFTLDAVMDKVDGDSDPDANLRDVCDRLLFSQAIEAVRCLEEGVITDTIQGNVGSVNQVGFPLSLGGVFLCIDSYGFGAQEAHSRKDDELGATAFAQRAKGLADLYGNHFNPPELLLQKATTAATFW